MNCVVFCKDCKGQGSLEMLLLIGAAVVVAFGIGFYLKTLAAQNLLPIGQNQITQTTNALSQ